MRRKCNEYRHFNGLTSLGMWSLDTRGMTLHQKIRRRIFLFVVYLTIISAVVVQLSDLYFVSNDFEKATYNLCSSALVIAILMKLSFMNQRRQCMNKLRVSLWEDSLLIDEEEDREVFDGACSDLKILSLALYSAVAALFALVTVSYYIAYWNGSTELPFPAYLPLKYPLALTYEIVCFAFVTLVAVEDELVGFTLYMQLIAYYDILKNKLGRLDKVYGKEENAMKQAKALIKYCVRRHLELMEYVKMVEHIYHRCMVVQVFLGGFLILMNGVVLIVFATELSRKLCYEMIIIFLLIVDILLICHYSSKLTLQCLDVGNAAYSTAWYTMDISTQKSLYMLMVGSRKPPKMTAGKIILMDLHTYMLMLRNIFSWLMLIRELVNKKSMAGEI